MRKGSDTYAELCDLLCSTACFTTCARRLGVSPASVFRWLAASAKDPAAHTFEWAGEVEPLHAHARRAIRMQAAAVEASARHRALTGRNEPIFYQGRPQWKEREDIIRDGNADADPDILELLYGQRDIYERDAAGHRIQLTLHHDPSDGLVGMVLKAHMPKLYGTKIEQTVQHAGGVLHLHAAPQRPKPVAAPDGEALPALAAPSVAALEHEDEDDEVEDQGMDSEPHEDLDPEALRAGYDPDDDVADDGPEPPRPFMPPPSAPIARDADMARAHEGIGNDAVAPGGYKVR